MRRIALFLSHAIEEFDQLKLLSSLGHEVVSVGGYVRPDRPHVGIRPPLPEVPTYEDAARAVEEHQSDGSCAQTHVPDALLEWLGDDGTLIWHHMLDSRLFPQWDRLSDWRKGSSGRRIIWRTVGQSVENNELQAAAYRGDGLEIVRYSPNERHIPGYAGEDALIRFYKDPEEWDGWRGDEEAVLNITQDLARRDPWCNPAFWVQATDGLPRCPMGPGSEALGGPGEVSYEDMREALRSFRCYLYTGTQPASYTLGLLEALMTGIPVVSIGKRWMQIFQPYGPELFEGDELSPLSSDDPDEARRLLEGLLSDHEVAQRISQHQRFRTRKTFGREPVAAAWKEFLA